jgi:hypothetical protein
VSSAIIAYGIQHKQETSSDLKLASASRHAVMHCDDDQEGFLDAAAAGNE